MATTFSASLRDLDNSRPFDETLTTDHPALLDLAANLAPHLGAKRKDDGKALRLMTVLLANLYAAWEDDPAMSVGISMSGRGYVVKSRYNPLRVSKAMIPVVNALAAEGAIEKAAGFFDQNTKVGRLTRVWPSPGLARSFNRARRMMATTQHAMGTEVLLRRDDDKDLLQYEDDDRTRAMRSVLNRYNDALAKTFVDIPELDLPYIERPDGRRVVVSQRDKWVRRIFNRGSWDKGGRFYGGWWQRCPKIWRNRIFINDHPTIEDDYSGLHIVMLYAWRGIDYWQSVGPDEDPYAITVPGLDYPPDTLRGLAKRLMLIALNAQTDRKALAAFRQAAEDDGDEAAERLTSKEAKAILAALREKHHPIADDFGSDKGIDLMNQDARITEGIIRRFVDVGRPILSIHDSYIVSMGDDGRLRDAMQESFAEVTGVHGVHLKRVGLGFQLIQAIPDSAKRAGMAEELLASAERPRSEGYLRRLERFHSW